jgi:xylulokinase
MVSKGKLLLGVDIGTGSCKLKLLTTYGEQVTSLTTPFSTYYPRKGWVEQDPSSWWNATLRLLRRCRVHLRKVECLAFSSQMESIVPVNEAGKVLGRSILWSDERSLSECNEIRSRLGDRVVHKITGCMIDPMHSGPKILWLRNHQRKRFSEAKKFLSPKDFLNYLITGEFVSDYSVASSSLLFDVKKRAWSDEILGKLGIPIEKLPEVYPSKAVIGEVTPRAAIATGLKTGTPVVAGGGDTPCTALGCGISKPRQGFVYLGSSASLYSTVNEAKTDDEMRLITRCHVMNDIWTVGGGMTTAGSCVTWLRDILVGAARKGRTLNDMLNEASRIRAGSDGLLFIPHMMGERNPHYRLRSTAALLGLTLAHTRSHILRAILEGIAMQLYSILRSIEDIGVRPNSLCATGGGVSFSNWTQILSDTFGRELAVPHIASPEAVGAAILAGIGTGNIADIQKFTSKLFQRRYIRPRKEAHAVYSKIYEKYKISELAWHSRPRLRSLDSAQPSPIFGKTR